MMELKVQRILFDELSKYFQQNKGGYSAFCCVLCNHHSMDVTTDCYPSERPHPPTGRSSPAAAAAAAPAPAPGAAVAGHQVSCDWWTPVT